VIHQESVAPLAHFPTLSYDRSLDAFFHSFDGKLNTLRVETYGGGSWLTEFSLLTGLSTYSFGGMRQFLQQVMAGKVGDTLPQALARCGYRNVLFYPMLRHFLSSAKFFEAVGLSEIVDAKAQGASRANEGRQCGTVRGDGRFPTLRACEGHGTTRCTWDACPCSSCVAQ
jgi:phosphoglycerol transferase MdoB-like AlkP superfamily enzyme